MKDQKKRGIELRIVSWLLGALLMLCSCAGSQNQGQSQGDAVGDSGSDRTTQGDAAAYEESLQRLESQLRQMSEDMASLKEDYLKQAEQLQSAMDTWRESGEQQTVQDPSHGIDADADTKNQAQGTPSYATDQSEAQTGEGTASDPDKSTAPQTSEYRYEEREDGIVLTQYIGKGTSVVVPAALNGKRVVGLADRAFAETSVCSVTLPQTVTELGWFTFYGCHQLKNVVLPASVEKIGYACFDGCHADLILTVSSGSYAQRYAASFALHYQIDQK